MRLDDPKDRHRLLEGLVEAALAAGHEINLIFDGGFAIETKADHSPVTAADRAGEAVILAALRVLAPGIPVVAEEEVSEGRIPEVKDRFFLVDALDGTREFVKRGSDFTVNTRADRGRDADNGGGLRAPAQANVRGRRHPGHGMEAR